MIYKRGKFYWYRFKFRGKLYRSSTKIFVGKGVPGEPSPKEKAKQYEAGKRQQLALGEVGIKQKPAAPLFSEFVKKFDKWLTERADKQKHRPVLQRPNSAAAYVRQTEERSFGFDRRAACC